MAYDRSYFDFTFDPSQGNPAAQVVDPSQLLPSNIYAPPQGPTRG